MNIIRFSVALESGLSNDHHQPLSQLPFWYRLGWALSSLLIMQLPTRTQSFISIYAPWQLEKLKMFPEQSNSIHFDHGQLPQNQSQCRLGYSILVPSVCHAKDMFSINWQTGRAHQTRMWKSMCLFKSILFLYNYKSILIWVYSSICYYIRFYSIPIYSIQDRTGPDKQTNRKTDRQTGRHAGRQADRQTGRERETHTEAKAETETDRLHRLDRLHRIDRLDRLDRWDGLD